LQIILSTSQTEFSDLKDEVPTLTPWTIRLATKNIWSSGNDILYSREEYTKKAELKARKDAIVFQKPHRTLFGVDHPHAVTRPAFGVPSATGNTFGVSQTRNTAFGAMVATRASNPFGAPSAAAGGSFGSAPAPSRGAAVPSAGGLFGVAPRQGGGGLFSSTDAAREAEAVGSSLFCSTVPSTSAAPGGFGSVVAPETAVDRIESSAAPNSDDIANAELATTIKHAKKSSSLAGGLFGSLRRSAQPTDGGDNRAREKAIPADESVMEDEESEPSIPESSFEEMGLTSTYDLLGHKTLTPSATASKQRVATVAFTSVMFSRTIVAKYRPAAYLQARLRNGARMTLLPGPAGLTLDDCFLGRGALPRCSPGDTFTLSLGIDPAILISYPKPEVRRSQSGILTREDSQVYTRTITLTNTRAGSDVDADGPRTQPVSLTVLDQVPVSEDDRLRIDVLQPRGLVLDGSGVTTGAAGSREGRKIGNDKPTTSKEDKDWGKAVARLKKGGEVAWDVSLNAGRTVKLTLEYECACRTGEHAVNA
jgi:hypothetical protein